MQQFSSDLSQGPTVRDRFCSAKIPAAPVCRSHEPMLCGQNGHLDRAPACAGRVVENRATPGTEKTVDVYH